jgi:polygalacturonase
VEIRGITVVDGGQWHVVPGGCKNVEIEDINIMSRVCTGDGIDIVGCEDVIVRNSFIRASDDCICIKAASHPDPAANRNVKNILAESCVLWNAEPGNALEIGYELRCDEVCDITFRDIDVVHCEYEGSQSGGVLTIHNADRAYIHDIYYEDIRIEAASYCSISMPEMAAM